MTVAAATGDQPTIPPDAVVAGVSALRRGQPAVHAGAIVRRILAALAADELIQFTTPERSDR